MFSLLKLKPTIQLVPRQVGGLISRSFSTIHPLLFEKPCCPQHGKPHVCGSGLHSSAHLQSSAVNNIWDNPTSAISDILENNRRWVKQTLEKDPEYFKRLTAGQHPRFLFIGCSDSRVNANEIMG